MEFFMFATGLLMIVVIILSRLSYDLKLENCKLRKENEKLRYEIAADKMPINKEIIFDSEGGFKVIDKDERPETVSV
jgi:hypothetical protein